MSNKIKSNQISTGLQPLDIPLTNQIIWRSSGIRHNLQLDATVVSDELVVDLTGYPGAGGSDPSESNPVTVVVSNTGSTTGGTTSLKYTSPTSITISASDSLGFSESEEDYLYVYAVASVPNPIIAITKIPIANETIGQDIVDYSGGANDSNTLYSDQAKSNAPVGLIGRFKAIRGSGAWNSTSEVSSWIPGMGQLVENNVRISSSDVTPNYISDKIADNPLSLGISPSVIDEPLTSGYQVVNFGGNLTGGGDATGLSNDSTVYSFDISIDSGSTQTVEVVGSEAQTISLLLTYIHEQIFGAAGGFLIPVIQDGNIQISSRTTGTSSSVSITNDDLFLHMTNFSSIDSAVQGTSNSDNKLISIVPSQGASSKIVSVRRTSNQSISSSSTEIVDWQTASENNHKMWTSSLAKKSRLTVPPGLNHVEIFSKIDLDTAGAFPILYKNGSALTGSVSGLDEFIEASSNTYILRTGLIEVSELDYFEIAIDNTANGSAINVLSSNSWFQIRASSSTAQNIY